MTATLLVARSACGCAAPIARLAAQTHIGAADGKARRAVSEPQAFTLNLAKSVTVE